MTLCNEYEDVWDWQKSRMMNLHWFSLLPDWPPRPSALHNNKRLLRLCTRNDHTNYIMYQNNEQSVLQCCYGNTCLCSWRLFKKNHVENAIFARKKSFRQTLANPTFIFSGTCWPSLVRPGKKNMDVWYPQICSRRLIPCHTSFCGSCT